MHWKALFLLLVCSFVGCMDATKIAPPISQLGITQNMEMLENGRNIFLTRCTKCHNAVRITRYPLQYWQEEILPGMSKESKLSPKQEHALAAYVEAVITHAKLKSESDASFPASGKGSDRK